MKRLFLIILIVIMIFLIASNYLNRNRNRDGFSGDGVKEGLISGPYLTETTIKQYNPNKLVFKLYDNLYYDNANGNVIELVTDSSNNVILNIFPRNFGDSTVNLTYSYYNTTSTTSQVTSESLLKSLIDASSTWSYKSTSKYQITVIPFNKDTYMHIMDITTQSPNIVLSAYFTDPAGTNTNEYHAWVVSDNSDNIIPQSLGVTSGTYSGTSTSTDKTNVVEPYYDNSKSLYQISQYVKYDAANGNLCVEGRTSSGSKNITVYSRTGVTTVYDASNNATTLGGTTPSSTVNTLITNTSNPILIHEKISPNIIIYWPVDANTVIMEYKGVLDTNNYGLAMVSVTLYNNSTIYKRTVSKTTTTTAVDSSVSMSDMMKMMWMWKNMGGDAAASSDYQLSDYVPKTSIVPPVCPACPSCPGVSCPSCGGANGSASGTSGGVNAPHEETAGLIDKTGTAIGHGIASTGRFVGEGIKDTASFAKSGIEGTASFAKSAITETAESAEGAAKYVGTGVGNFLGRLTGGGGAASAGAGGAAGGVGGGAAPAGYVGSVTDGAYKPDVYSYGGAMPSQYQSQGGLQNIQPLIADFSKFGR